MRPDSVQDSTRYVISDSHSGSVIPGKRTEMIRDVYINSGADISGGVYGNNIQIEGSNIRIKGSLYSRANIQITSSEKKKSKDITLESTVVSSSTLLCKSNKVKIRLLSDIYAEQVNLKNCIVYGNLYANSANLEDTIVLGGVFCRKGLKLSNSMLFTFRAENCQIGENVSLLSPFGMARDIDLTSKVNILSFTHLFSDEQLALSGSLVLDDSDIYQIGAQNQSNSVSEKQKPVQVISVVERLLNTKEIIHLFKQNKDFIEFLSLHSHLSEKDKQDFAEISKDEIEKKMWYLIENKSKLNQLEGSKSIKEMFETFQG